MYATVLFYCVHNISVGRVGVSSPPTGVAGSSHSQATPGSPLTSSVSSTTTASAAAATPLTSSQHNKGIIHIKNV